MSEKTAIDFEISTVDLDHHFNNSTTRMCIDYMLWIDTEVERGKCFDHLWNYYIMVMRGLELCPLRATCKKCGSAIQHAS